MRQGLLYEDDVKSVTKVVKACISKLNKEWEKVSEQKLKEDKEGDSLSDSGFQKGQSSASVQDSYQRSDTATAGLNSRISNQTQFESQGGQTQYRGESQAAGEALRHESSGFYTAPDSRTNVDNQVSYARLNCFSFKLNVPEYTGSKSWVCPQIKNTLKRLTKTH